MESLKIKQNVLQKALGDVLENAKVPLKHHLSVVKKLEETVEQGKKDREQHQKMLLIHAKELSQAHAHADSLATFIEQQKKAHDNQIAGYEEELERHKQLKQGEPGYTPQRGVDYFDAQAPSVDEIVARVVPLIPEPLKGDKGKDAELDKDSFITEVVNYIRKNKSLDMSHIRNGQSFVKDGIRYKFEELMKGGGSTGGGGAFTVLPATGTINDSNKTFSFTSTPTAVAVNGAVYINGQGVTITTNAATLDNPVGVGGSIYGIK